MPLRQNSFLDTAYHLELNPQQYLDYILNERVKIKEYKSMTKCNFSHCNITFHQVPFYIM